MLRITIPLQLHHAELQPVLCKATNIPIPGMCKCNQIPAAEQAVLPRHAMQTLLNMISTFKRVNTF